MDCEFSLILKIYSPIKIRNFSNIGMIKYFDLISLLIIKKIFLFLNNSAYYHFAYKSDKIN